jgi:Secretion system C-terminal sorting domain
MYLFMQSRNLFPLFLLICNGLYSQNTIPQPTSMVNKYPWQVPEMMNIDSNTYLYNADNLLKEADYYRGYTGQWNLQNRYIYTYDSNDNLTQELTKIWNPNTNTLDNYSRTITTYTPGNLVASYTSQSFVSNIWNTVRVVQYSYTPTGKLSEGYLNYTSPNLYDIRYKYTYDQNDRLIENIIEYNNANGGWDLIWRYTYTYLDGDDKKDMQRVEKWENSGDTTWSYYSNRDIFTYFENPTTTEILKEAYVNYTDSLWRPEKRVTEVLNSDELPHIILEELYRFDLDSFVFQYETEYFYNNNKSTSCIKLYSTSPQDPYEYRRRIFYYSNTSNTESASLSAKIETFPNPTTNLVQIKMDELVGQNVNIAIFDAQGRLVKQQRTTAGFAQISMLNQPSGMYNLRIESNGAFRVFPLVVAN